MMQSRRLVEGKQFLAVFTILSLILTQVLPTALYAAPVDSTQHLRPAGLEGTVQAGLEAAFRGSILSDGSAAVLSSRFPDEVAHDLEWWRASRINADAAAAYYDANAQRAGKSDCRVCAMRGNVIKGIPNMLHLMLTGGYDGAGIAVKIRVKGNHHIILVKDAGHLDALLQEMYDQLDREIRSIVAHEYGVNVSEVALTGPSIWDDASYEVDPAFGAEVLRLKVKGQIVSVPMEGIGHTRWRTVGRAIQENSHPFRKEIDLQLPDGRNLVVALAHNGNFSSYKLFLPHLTEAGIDWDGETDSEVLAALFGLMHRDPDGAVASDHTAFERLLRFVKYVEDYYSLISLAASSDSDARRSRAALLTALQEELRSLGLEPPDDIVEVDLLDLAKGAGSDVVIRLGLEKPWIFDLETTDSGKREDLAVRFSRIAVAESSIRSVPAGSTAEEAAKRQAAFRQKFFDRNYSSIAVAAMSNAEEGVVVARGRKGGELEVYVPPLKAIRERMVETHPRLNQAGLPQDVSRARALWRPELLAVRQQLHALQLLHDAGDLWLPSGVRDRLDGLYSRTVILYERWDRTDRLPPDINLAQEKLQILGLVRDVEQFAQPQEDPHDVGRRIVASERRAIPGVEGSAREHPEPRFRNAGRGEVDTYGVGTGHVVTVRKKITRSAVWETELGNAPGKTIPKPAMVDLANLDIGAASSRLEREIANQVHGWASTLRQFEDGNFPDLNYTDDQLKDIEEWYFVAEGTSGFLSQVAEMIGEGVPGSSIRFKVMTGKEFQAKVASGQIETRAKELAQRNRRVMVTAVSNTGSTETIKNAVEEVNKLNLRLNPAQKAMLSVVTNVAGSAIDNAVSLSDGDRHAAYTLVGYEMAVPATGSLNVGVMAASLLVTKVLAVQGAFPEGAQVAFSNQLRKLQEAVRNLEQVFDTGSNGGQFDGAIHLTAEFQQRLDNVLTALRVTDLDPAVWISGWWVWRVGAEEAELKFKEATRSKGPQAFDIISGKHGPYAILRPGYRAVVFLPSSKAFPEGFETVLQGLRELRTRVDYSERGGETGKLILLMDEADIRPGASHASEISDMADVIVPLPDMDNAVTGFMYSMLFVQLMTVYGARARFEPMRELLSEMDRRIRSSGILGREIRLFDDALADEKHPATVMFNDASEFLSAYSVILTEPQAANEAEGRRILSALKTRNPDHFEQFRREAQTGARTYTEAALDVTQRVVDEAIGGGIRSSEWDQLRSDAAGWNRGLKKTRDRLLQQRERLARVLANAGMDLDWLREAYQRVDAYSLSPAEAVKFIGSVGQWREFTETYVRHLSKQISGVEAGLESPDAASPTVEEEANRTRDSILTRVDRYQRLHARFSASETLPSGVPFPDELVLSVANFLSENRLDEAEHLLRSVDDRLGRVRTSESAGRGFVQGLQRLMRDAVELLDQLRSLTQGLDQVDTMVRQFNESGTGQMLFAQMPPVTVRGISGTGLVIVSRPGQAGAFQILVDAVSRRRSGFEPPQLNIRRGWTEDSGEGPAVSVVIVEALPADLEERGVIAEIEEAVRRANVGTQPIPRPDQFREAVIRELDVLSLPKAGADRLVGEAVGLFEAFERTGRPQAKQFRNPVDGAKSIVIALDADRPGLEMDVLDPISRESEANIGHTEAARVGGLSFFVLDVEDRSADQIAVAVQRIRRRLEGARMPESFEAHMRQFLDRMPNASLRSIYGKVRGIQQDPGEPNEVILSLNVPDSTAQVAMTFVVRQDAASGLRDRLLELISAQGLQVVETDDGEPKSLLVETDYADDPAREPVHILRAVISAPRDSGQVKAVLDAMKGEFSLHSAASGLEALRRGVHYTLDADGSALFLNPVEVLQSAVLDNGVSLNPLNGSITIGQGAVLFKNASVMGPAVIGARAEAGGILRGTADRPLVVGPNARIHRPEANVKESVIGPWVHINGADINGSTVVAYRRGDVTVPASVDTSSVVREGSTVIGGTVGTHVKLYDGHVVGPYATTANNSEHAAGFMWGAAEKGGTVGFPHEGFTEVAWIVPVTAAGQAEYFTPAYHEKLKAILRAVVMGELVSQELAEEAPVSSSGNLFRVTFRLDGEEITFLIQRINIGANGISSDYSPLTGVISSTIMEAGAATGVNAVLKAPSLVAFRALVGNGREAGGFIAPGTVLVGAPKALALEGYRDLEKGFTLPDKFSQHVQVQFDYFHRVALSAEVLAEAASRAADPFELAGYAAAVRSIHEAFNRVGPRYMKALTRETLELSIKNLEAQRAAFTPDILSAIGNGGDGARFQHGRLVARINDQTQLLVRLDEITADYEKNIVAVLDRAFELVGAVSQADVAGWVKERTLDSEATWTNPLAPAPMGSGLEAVYRASGDRSEYLPADLIDGLVTVGLKPGQVGLLQWADGLPKEENSDFALFRVASDGESLEMLDQRLAQFVVAAFRGADSQMLQGARIPAVVGAEWDSAAAGSDLTVETGEADSSISVRWSPGAHALTADFGGRRPHVIFQRLEPARSASGLEDAGLAAGQDVSVPAAAVSTGVIATVSHLRQALSGFDRISVSVRDGQPVLIVTTGGLGLLPAIALLELPDGQSPPVEVLARDAAHQARLEGQLTSGGFRNFTVHNLEREFDGNEGQALADLSFNHILEGRNPIMVSGSTTLADLADLLGAAIPEAARRALEGIIDRSHQIWL